jgi:hypothetical protein
MEENVMFGGNGETRTISTNCKVTVCVYFISEVNLTQPQALIVG